MGDLRQQLETLVRRRPTFVGVGNVDLGDDGFGVRFAELLTASGFPAVVTVGNDPASLLATGELRGVSTVVFLDAVDLASPPGSIALLDAASIQAKYPQVSTHRISLGTLSRLLMDQGASEVRLLGVQPESLQFGSRLSPAVQRSLGGLLELLTQVREHTTDIHFDESHPAGRGTRPSPSDRCAITAT